MNPTYTVKVNRSIELIYQLIDLADESVWLVLEGDLSQFHGSGLAGVERASRENAGYALNRPNNRVMIPLTAANVPTLKINVLPRVGIRAQICHVFLECNGRILFTAYDHFKNGAQFSNWISDDELTRLAQEGIIEREQEPEEILISGHRRNHEPFYHVNQPHGGYSYGKH